MASADVEEGAMDFKSFLEKCKVESTVSAFESYLASIQMHFSSPSGTALNPVTLPFVAMTVLLRHPKRFIQCKLDFGQSGRLRKAVKN
jgi:hypothetical protein